MKTLAADLIRDETETILSTSLREEAKPISTKAGRATIEERSNEFKILKNRANILEKLGKQELKITEQIQNLRLNLEHLDWYWLDRKQRQGLYEFRNAQHDLKYNLREVEDLKKYLYETYENFNNQIVKLHKGVHHGSIKSVKERQLFKQIKQTRGEAEKMRPVKFWCKHMHDVNLDTKEALKDHIEVLSRKTEELRMIRMSNRAYGRIDSDKVAIEKEITILESKLENIKQMKVEASIRHN